MNFNQTISEEEEDESRMEAHRFTNSEGEGISIFEGQYVPPSNLSSDQMVNPSDVQRRETAQFADLSSKEMLSGQSDRVANKARFDRHQQRSESSFQNSNHKLSESQQQTSSARRTVSAFFAGISHRSQQDSINVRKSFTRRRQEKHCRVHFTKRLVNITNGNIYDALFNFTPPKHDSKERIARKHKKEISWYHRLYETIPVFRPDNVWFLLWEFLIFIITCVIFFTIPIEIMFEQEFSISSLSEVGLSLRVMVFLLLTLDALSKLNMAYYEKGKLVTARRMIFKNYFTHFFDGNGFTDTLGLIGLLVSELQNYQDQIKFQSFICLLIYVRLINLNQFDTLIIKKLQLNRKTKCAYQLLRLAMVVLFISNVWACFFYRAGKYEEETTGIWWMQKVIETTGYTNPQFEICYLYSLYWSVTTMISVGYGDVTPVMPLEVLVTIFCMLCSCIVFAYSINSIWQLISEVSMGDKRYEQNMNAINRYMRDKSVSPGLKSRIQAYLDFHWKDTKSREEIREQEIIKQLPQNLKLELIYEANSFFFSKFEWSKHFSFAFLQLLAQYIKEKKYLEGDIVYHNVVQQQAELDEDADPSFYYVEEGDIQMYYDLTFYNNGFGIPIQSVKAGNLFGLYEFFTGENRHESARCIEFSNLFSISRSDFLKVIQNFPEDYSTFLRLRDEMIFNKNFGLFGLQCQLCAKSDHLSHNCVENQVKTNMIARKKLLINQEKQLEDYFKEQSNSNENNYLKNNDGLSNSCSNNGTFEGIYPDINIRQEYEVHTIKKRFDQSDNPMKNWYINSQGTLIVDSKRLGSGQAPQTLLPLLSVSSASSMSIPIYASSSNTPKLGLKTPLIQDQVQMLEDDEDKRMRQGFQGKIRKSRHFSSLMEQREIEVDMFPQPSVFVQTQTEVASQSMNINNNNTTMKSQILKKQNTTQNLRSSDMPSTPIMKPYDSLGMKNAAAAMTTSAVRKQQQQQEKEHQNKAVILQNISIQHRISSQRKSMIKSQTQIQNTSNLQPRSSPLLSYRKNSQILGQLDDEKEFHLNSPDRSQLNERSKDKIDPIDINLIAAANDNTDVNTVLLAQISQLINRSQNPQNIGIINQSTDSKSPATSQSISKSQQYQNNQQKMKRKHSAAVGEIDVPPQPDPDSLEFLFYRFMKSQDDNTSLKSNNSNW